MSINETRWKQAIQSASTFQELEQACRKLPALHICADDILAKIGTLPVMSIADGFVQYLCTMANQSNRTSPEGMQLAFSNTANNMLRAYATRVVDEGILKEGTNVISYFTPVIVLSAERRENIGTEYCIACNYDVFSKCDPQIIRALFIDGEFDVALNLAKDCPDTHRAVNDIIAILTNEVVYSSFITTWNEDYLRNAFNSDIRSTAIVIARTFQAKSSEDWTKSGLDEEDIYTWLTYLLATYNLIVPYQSPININSTRMYAEDLFQSFEVINQHIGLMETVSVNWRLDLIDLLIKKSYQLFSKTIVATKERCDVIEKCMKEASFHADENEPNSIQLAVCIPAIERYIPDRCQIAMEDYDKSSTMVDKASRKIYRGYKSYKDAEKKVDSQLSKMATALKQQLSGNPRDRIIEGEKFSVVRVIKKIVTTAAIFSFNKVAGILYVIVKYCTGKNADNKERRAIISELKLEIKLLDEKIEDARGDGNRQAKYSMMRTRAELQKAVDQIQYGLKADKRALQTAKDIVSGRKSTSYRKDLDADPDME